jgi:glucose/arabinose dehydrogenase
MSVSTRTRMRSLTSATLACASLLALFPAQAPAAAVDETLKQIRLPPGFRIELFAMVPDARQIAVAPGGGTVIVGTRRSRVWMLRDGAKDGAAESVAEFAPSIGFKVPNGVCFAPDGTLYVVEHNRVQAFPGAGSVASRTEITPVPVLAQGKLIPESEESGNHGARTCRIGPDNKLYITLGAPFNVAPKAKLALYDRLGMMGIIRIDRDGGRREVFARGVRNSVGMDFNPADKTLWFTDNQVDGMGDDIPPGELNRATKAGQHYGYPWYGGGRVRTAEYRNDTPPAGAVFPAAEMAAHAADLGMTFYSGKMFPAKYRGGIFSAQHGSWNRSTPVGARLMFTPVKADGGAGKPEVFAEGWLNASHDYLGRPVDVAALPDGSLLVSDDDAGALYRISYGAQTRLAGKR